MAEQKDSRQSIARDTHFLNDTVETRVAGGSWNAPAILEGVLSCVFDLDNTQWLREPSTGFLTHRDAGERFRRVVEGKILAALRDQPASWASSGCLAIFCSITIAESQLGDFFADVAREAFRFLKQPEKLPRSMTMSRCSLMLHHLSITPEFTGDSDVTDGASDNRNRTVPDERNARSNVGADKIERVIQKIRWLASDTNGDVLDVLSELQYQVEISRKLLAREIEVVFNRFEGREFSPEQTRHVATLMDSIATSLELRFAGIAADESEFIASLRSGPSGRPNDERFQYQVYEAGRSTIRRSSKTLLHSTLVPAGRDGRRRNP